MAHPSTKKIMNNNDNKKTYICETCGEEFTEDYRKSKSSRRTPIRFCSRLCARRYVGNLSPNKFQKGHPGYLKGYYNSAGEFVPREYNKLRDDLFCKYCGKQCKSLNSLKNHEIRCSKNPQRIPLASICHKGYNGNHRGSNQFIKARKLGLEIPKLSLETRKKISTSLRSKNRHHTEEEKKHLSETRIKFLKEHPEKVPYKLNHSSKESYPEKYFREVLKEYISNNTITQEYQISYYSLDFANVLKKKDFEVDGEQHYVDSRIVESDKRRNKFLSENGWDIYRLRWSEFQRLSEEEKIDKVGRILDFLEVKG